MIVLNGKRMESRGEIHAELKEKLDLPDYYGSNLDALNDCLGERSERELVVIADAGTLLEADGAYAAKLLRVFSDNGMQVLLD